MRETQAAILNGAQAIWIDLSATNFLWSAGLAALMRAVFLARGAGCRATVCIREGLRTIMELANVGRLASLVIVKDEKEAA